MDKKCVCGGKITFEGLDKYTGEIILVCTVCKKEFEDAPAYLFQPVA